MSLRFSSKRRGTKSLVTTCCHQQKVCWQPAVFSNTTVYLACSLGNLPESRSILNTVIENLNKYWIRKYSNEFTIWYFFYRKRRSLHCTKVSDKKIYCLQFAYQDSFILTFFDTSTALREQIYYNIDISLFALFTMDEPYWYKLLKHQNQIESYFLGGKSLRTTNQDPRGAIWY